MYYCYFLDLRFNDFSARKTATTIMEKEKNIYASVHTIADTNGFRIIKIILPELTNIHMLELRWASEVNENTRRIILFISRHINAMTCFLLAILRAIVPFVVFIFFYLFLFLLRFILQHLILVAFFVAHFNNIHKLLDEVHNVNYNELVWLVRKLK